MTNPPEGMDVSPSTLDEALRFWAATTPQREALADGRSTWTYEQLHAEVDRFAAGLSWRGVGPEDRVVLLGNNTLAWVCAYLACLRIGAIVAPANNRLSSEQFRDQCNVLGASLVLHDDAHAPVARAAHPDIVLDFAALRMPDRGDSMSFPTVSAESPALISFTSGTTGSPKGAVLSHKALYCGSSAFAEFLGTTREDSTLVLVPMFHNTGFVDQLGHMLVVGGSTRLISRYRTADVLAELASRPVTFMTAVPSILRLLMVSENADAAFAGAHTVLYGGSPMPIAWTAELQRRWPQLRLVHGYGLTEFTSACTFLPPDLASTHGESVGTPAPGVRLRVADPQGDNCPARMTGEVWVAGPTRMSGYWGRPRETDAKLTGEWLRTGDLGYLDEQGLLWLVGRVDDVINRGGEKILPAFVESRLAEIPAIAEASVFGYPDPILQQRVAAAIQLRPGRRFDEDDARKALAARLPDYAIPERWVIYRQLPTTASGKADRRQIAREYADALATPSAPEGQPTVTYRIPHERQH